jgi:hypothetical protein
VPVASAEKMRHEGIHAEIVKKHDERKQQNLHTQDDRNLPAKSSAERTVWRGAPSEKWSMEVHGGPAWTEAPSSKWSMENHA